MGEFFRGMLFLPVKEECNKPSTGNFKNTCNNTTGVRPTYETYSHTDGTITNKDKI